MELKEENRNGTTLIEIEHIAKIYRMGTEYVHALRDITLQINKNDYLAIMGPSGSGKSTLMNIIGCLDTPTKGKYLFKEMDVSEMTDNDLASIRNKEIGFVFQTFNLLSRSTSLKNVELPLIYGGFGASARHEKAMKAMENVGLGDRVNHKPNELSGGQRQRVAVARALVTEPSIILADEPTGNLDSKTGLEIMNLFNELWKAGNTIIVVTHEEEVARFAKRIIKLRDGLIEHDSVNHHQKSLTEESQS